MEPRACSRPTIRDAGTPCTPAPRARRGCAAKARLHHGRSDDKIGRDREDVGPAASGVRSTCIPSIARGCSRRRKPEAGEMDRHRSEVFLSDEQGRDVASGASSRSMRRESFLALRLPMSRISAPISRRPAVHQYPGRGRLPHRRLRRPGGVRAGEARGDQQVARRRVPRSRPPGDVLHARAPGRSGGARAGHGPGRAAPQEPGDQGQVSLQGSGAASSYDCGDFEGVLDDALRASDWTGSRRGARSHARDGSCSGAAWPCTSRRAAAVSRPPIRFELRFGADGAVTMYAVSHSHGRP